MNANTRRLGMHWLRLDGAGLGDRAGLYSWTEMEPGPKGTWIATANHGSLDEDPAMEVNGNAALPSDTVVQGQRDSLDSSIRFQMGC